MSILKMRRLVADVSINGQARGLWARVVTVFAVVACLALVPGKLVGADLEDFLWDLHIVPLDNQPAPDFTLANLGGKKVSLSGLHGRAVLLYFWATW